MKRERYLDIDQTSNIERRRRRGTKGKGGKTDEAPDEALGEVFWRRNGKFETKFEISP